MKMKRRIGIYHYQYYRGACKLCYRHFIQEMVESYEKCHEVAEEIYGKENCEFLHYTDFGQYDSENTDRPSFRRIMEAIEKWAADEFRSTNGQLQWIIAEALRKSGRMKKKKTIIKKEETE